MIKKKKQKKKKQKERDYSFHNAALSNTLAGTARHKKNYKISFANQ
jgi:hypothetical protein